MKLGNPLLVLLQAPFQLLSHLLFDRQVSPDRYVQIIAHSFKESWEKFLDLPLLPDPSQNVMVPFPVLSPSLKKIVVCVIQQLKHELIRGNDTFVTVYSAN